MIKAYFLCWLLARRIIYGVFWRQYTAYLSPHPCFIPPSVFYPLIRVLSPHPCFIPSSVFYPLIRVLSPHPCFIPSSVFYPPSVSVSVPSVSVSVSVFYPNPFDFRPNRTPLSSITIISQVGKFG